MANILLAPPTNGLTRAIFIIIILAITFLLAKIIRKLLDKAFKRSSRKIRVEPTRFAILKHIISALIYILGIGAAINLIPQLKTLSVSLFASAGVLAVIVGFASQQAFSNIIGGIFIAIFRPFRVNDKIKVGTDSGVVEDITLRHTVIRNYENKRIIIPNSIIGNERIENLSIDDPKICKFVEFGISYDSDVDEAMKIMQEESEKHPASFDNRTEEDKKERKPKVTVRVLGFGDSSVNLRAWVWAKDAGDAFKIGCDLNRIIKKRFDKEGIEIPFPYRTIVYKKDIKKRK